LDNSAKAKIEYEISRIDKLLKDSSPLIHLCKLKEPDYIETAAMAQVLHSFFRHFIRHSYSSELKWNDMEHLVRNIEESWCQIKEDFNNFINDN
jgi:hypothetical protein